MKRASLVTEDLTTTLFHGPQAIGHEAEIIHPLTETHPVTTQISQDLVPIEAVHLIKTPTGSRMAVVGHPTLMKAPAGENRVATKVLVSERQGR